MSMTREEFDTKKFIAQYLSRHGYPTYALLFSNLALHLTNRPDVIGYMEPDKGDITINRNLQLKDFSVIIRHEILHHYLKHERRLLSHLAKKKGLNFDDLEDLKIKELKDDLYKNDVFNIAADYEISNRGYTEEDKDIIHSLELNGEIVSGLVTEDEHPDWVNKSVEDMYDLLSDEYDELENELKNQLKDMKSQSKGYGQGDSGQDQDQSDSTKEQGGGSSPGSNQKDNKQSKGSSGKKKIQIGDKGDPTDEIASEIQRLEDEIRKANNVEDVEDELKRMEELQKMLNDDNLDQEMKGEVEREIRKQERIKADRDLKKHARSGITKFKLALNDFIQDELTRARNLTWKKFNKNQSGNIMRKGVRRSVSGKIQKFNVYFDNSGSWGPEKIKIGQDAMAIMNKYVKREDIKVDTYYFSNKVSGIFMDPSFDGSTAGQPIIDHIEMTKPNNVIIMTDSDINDCISNITVDGGVWFLFLGGESANLMNHLKGKKKTKKFDL